MPKHVDIIRRRRLKQQWHGRFVAANGGTLASTEKYTNQDDLVRMLAVYFPGWDVRLK